MASVNSAIKIFCRVKPNQDPLTAYDVLTGDNAEEMLQLSLREEHPSTVAQAYLNNKPEQYKFRFTKVFDRTSRQDYIFQEVARPVIDSALQGYNGTIFAYGQTGTGKTYTMTGSRVSFNERGVIPRTLEYIFQRFEEDNNPSRVRNVFVSYLEIYNEAGYDLLNPSAMTGRMDDLGRVSLMEDGSQQMHLRNLSVHSIESVEEATQFLYLGDHNRTIAETPLNEVSTRSHCIFTIHLNMRDVNTSLTTRSKLHLVDLAGSERVSTICTTSQLATEARHINLALHYLEQVIVALGDSNRSHIPYRNSMMTSVLRDSLGGNCMTSMIATISLDPRNTQETLSTCRFAQRVAMVTNAVQRNEDLDPNIIITQLKSEVKKLREIIEANSVKPLKDNNAPLSQDELAICSYGVQQFLVELDPHASIPIPCDMRMIKECFRILKSHIQSRGGQSEFHSPPTPMTPSGNNAPGNLEETVNERNFNQLLARRDAEIKVLMDMIRKEKTKRSATATSLPTSKPSLENVIQTPLQPRPPISSRNRSRQENSENKLVPVNKGLGHGESRVLDVTSGNPDDQTFDESAFAQNFPSAKRVALLAFIKKYEGTESLEKLRSKLFEKRTEIRGLETSITSLMSNIQSMKKIAESSLESDTGLDMSSLTASMKNQERSLETQEERMNGAREEVDRMEAVLKSEYKKLLSDFENWWDMNQNIGSEIADRKLIDEEQQSVGTVFKKVHHELIDWSNIMMIEPMKTRAETNEMSGMEERSKEGGEGECRGHGQVESQPVTITEKNESTSPYTLLPKFPSAPPCTATPNQSDSDTDDPRVGDEDSPDEHSSGIPVTGDAQTDQEVLQFLQARKQVFQTIKQKKEQQNEGSSN